MFWYRRLLLVTILGVSSSSLASEVIYRWLDKDGVTRYSDTKPQDESVLYDEVPAASDRLSIISTDPAPSDSSAKSSETGTQVTESVLTPCEEYKETYQKTLSALESYGANTETAASLKQQLRFYRRLVWSHCHQ